MKYRPPSVLVIAILHFVGGGLGLIVDLCGGAQLAMNPYNTAQLRQNRQEKPFAVAYQEHLNQKLPYNQAVGLGGIGFDAILSLTMIVSGIGLIGMHAWGRMLSFVYAALSILIKIINGIYMFAIFLPVMNEFFSKWSPQSPSEQMAASMMKPLAYVSIIIGLLFVIYPIVVLIILNRPAVVAAFRGEETTAGAY